MEAGMREGITTGIYYNLPVSEVKLRQAAIKEYEEHFLSGKYDQFNPYWQGFKKGYELALKEREAHE